MINKGNILRALTRLDRKYNAALTSSDPRDPIDYSRLAVILYCGWLEESMDKIATRAVHRRTTTEAYGDMAKGKITNNHGFQYKTNFRKMMAPLIGIPQMERLELWLRASGDLLVLDSELRDIKNDRNNAAHAFETAHATYPAPSLLKSKVERLYPIFEALFSKMVHLR